MDADTYYRLADRTQLQDRARRMGYRVLVEGVSYREAADPEGVTRESARQAAARILRELRLEGGYPPEWECVTVVVPPDLASEIRESARSAKDQYRPD